MNLGPKVSEFNRLLMELHVKAALKVARGGTGKDEDNAAAMIPQLQAFIDGNLNDFPPALNCGGGCQWNENLQMCVCNVLFKSDGYSSQAPTTTEEGA